MTRVKINVLILPKIDLMSDSYFQATYKVVRTHVGIRLPINIVSAN